jgi:transcriptional regulator, tetR family
MVEIVEEGIKQGKFTSQYPKEYMEIVLCSAIVLLDDGIFERTEEEKVKLLAALISSLGKMLGSENVSFYNKIMKIL